MTPPASRREPAPDKRRERHGRRCRIRPWHLLVIAVAFMAVVGAGLAMWMGSEAMPRQWARYLDRRADGHNELIVTLARAVTSYLRGADRGSLAPLLVLPSWTKALGADPSRDGPKPAGRERVVANVIELERAVQSAEPGDVITIAPGNYLLDSRIRMASAGTPDKPIRIRAPSLGLVTINSLGTEAFVMAAPYWTLEQLVVRGVCGSDDTCEHAVHVVGAASHAVIRNNRFEDFNAHIKINGEGGRMPDFGLIEGNTLRNNRARKTRNPVTPIDLVAASAWNIRYNIVADFIRLGGDGVSYGVFAKGGGHGVRFDSNLIVCEQRLIGAPGQRVGLSFGGGGSSLDACRDKRCVVEHAQGVAVNNIIARCSDMGVYINRSSQTILEHNTIIDTAGVEARFGESSLISLANLVDGPVRSRGNAVLSASEDYGSRVMGAFVGMHRVRQLYADALGLDLRWRGEAPRRSVAGDSAKDACGKPRAAQPRFGAIEDLSAGC